MALGENQNKIQYTVTTSDDSFEFPYKYWDSSDIIVTKLASGIETNPAFTISPTNGDPENGGTVTLTSAVTSCTITIERVVPFASEADYKRGALSPDSLTENFDKSAAMSQQLSDEITRSLKIPTTDPAGLTYDIGTVAVRKNTVLGFDASGNTSNIDLVESGTVGVDTDAGLTIASNIISVNADGTSVGFDGAGAVEVKDDGITTAKILDDNVTTAKILDKNVTLAKMADIATDSVIGRTTAATGVPEVVPIVGATGVGLLINDDTLADDSDLSGATQGSIKAYVDTTSVAQAKNYAMQYSGAVAFATAAAPTTFTDLDLSAIVGTNRAFVQLLVTKAGGSTRTVSFYEFGDGSAFSEENGVSSSSITNDSYIYLNVTTAANGLVKWKASSADNFTVTVKCFQVLQ